MLKNFIVGVAWLIALTGTTIATADPRIAIIDAAFDTRKHLTSLGERGVKVIGRYYSRCAQPELGLTTKRLVDQGGRNDRKSEVSQLLGRGFAILSIYQYYNNSAQKFDGRTKKGRILRDANCEWTDEPRDVEDEARLDATAAVQQARMMRQPIKTAIYFGVDFNFAASNTDVQDKMVRYFRVIKDIVEAAGFEVGAYGSGLAHQILRAAKDKQGRIGLIAYSWISASRAFTNTSEFHRSKEWHLFQNQVDKEWFGKPINDEECTRGLALDTNVQNQLAEPFVGFWNKSGRYTLPVRRTRQIFKARRFACNGNAILRQARTSLKTDVLAKEVCFRGKRKLLTPKIDYANATRLGRRNWRRGLVEVDVDDDGSMDGWTWVGNLTKSFHDKPDWIFPAKERSEKICD